MVRLGAFYRWVFLQGQLAFHLDRLILK